MDRFFWLKIGANVTRMMFQVLSKSGYFLTSLENFRNVAVNGH